MDTFGTVSSAHGHSNFGAVVATAAIAFGIGYFAINAASQEEPVEMDTTTRLLSGGNRDRILASLEEYNQGRFVEHNIEDLQQELA